MGSTEQPTAPQLLEQCAGLLRECGLLSAAQHADGSAAPASLSHIVDCLITSTAPEHAELDSAQVGAWARCLSDLTQLNELAEQALQQGVLPALPRYLQRYKSNPPPAAAPVPVLTARTPVPKDGAWADALLSLHNFALLQDKGFTDALGKLQQPDLEAIAANLALALQPGRVPAGGSGTLLLPCTRPRACCQQSARHIGKQPCNWVVMEPCRA